MEAFERKRTQEMKVTLIRIRDTVTLTLFLTDCVTGVRSCSDDAACQST